MYEYAVKVLSVTDGDTIVAAVDLGLRVSKTETLRLAGIDTPELHSADALARARAQKAKSHVVSVLLGTPGSPPLAASVRVRTEKPYSQDKYGRWLGTVMFQTGEPKATWRCLNDELIAEGFGAAYDGGKRT